MRALWTDRPIALITCFKKLNVSGAFLIEIPGSGTEKGVILKGVSSKGVFSLSPEL